MQIGNRFENAYKLHTVDGVEHFLEDYPKLSESRFFSRDLSISDMLLDFHFAFKRALTPRQQEVISLTYFKDLKQSDVAAALGLTQQTVQEHIKKATKNLASYHLIQNRKEGE